MIADVKAKGSVRYTETNFIPRSGGAPFAVNSRFDIGAVDGSQVVTGVPGDGRVLVVNNAAYIDGSAAFLKSSFKITTTPANRWLHIANSSPLYKAAVGGLTMPSFLESLQPRGTLTAKPGRYDGRDGTAITGTPSPIFNVFNAPGGTVETVLVTNSPSPLPFAMILEDRQGARDVFTFAIDSNFSRWGEKLTFTAPASSIPYP